MWAAVGNVHILLDDTDDQSADDVDENDNDSGDRIAPDELACAVHCPVEVGFPFDLAPAPAGLRIGDQAGVQVGIDAHLLARHGVEGETGGDFGDARRALGDDDEVDQDEHA